MNKWQHITQRNVLLMVLLMIGTHSALQAGTPIAWNGVPEVQIGKDKSGSNNWKN